MNDNTDFIDYNSENSAEPGINSDPHSEDNYVQTNEYHEKEASGFLKLFFPSILFLFLLSGFTQVDFENEPEPNQVYDNVETDQAFDHKLGEFNILSEEDLGGNILDTVYTDKDNWLELRIHEQYVYQHWRDGHTVKYPVSTGNKALDKGLESRPGLFAVFVKEEHHQSSQFDNADMYHFMPFNQGIGFHSINGTGYYGSLGVRPSSHGCIRMKHEDVQKMFGQTEMGTLVLAHNGSYARTVAFAPKNYNPKKEQNYSKEEYQKMLAENLFNVLNGKYYVTEKKFFVVDPSVIPKSGVYVSYDVKVPEKQQIPKESLVFKNDADKLSIPSGDISLISTGSENIFDESSWIVDVSDKNVKDIKKIVTSSDDLVKKYFNNPIGVLPYYPPTGGKVVKRVASN
ncbi:hypothetical protein BH10BAC5_BH10BAC5_19910 [soil metagenome]